MVVPRITAEDLERQLGGAAAPSSPLVVVDVRLKYPYEHSTITLPGALRLLPGAPDRPALPRDRGIVLYDSDPAEIVAERIAAELIRDGFRVAVLEGGIAAWAAAKYPTTAKSAPHLAVPMGAPAKS